MTRKAKTKQPMPSNVIVSVDLGYRKSSAMF